MSKLVAQYDMFVYDDGKVVIQPKQSTNNVNNCSNSIAQIVGVLDYVSKNALSEGIRKSVSNGINKVASDKNLTSSSVHTKCTRKLNLEMKQFKDLVETYFNGTSDELEYVLRNACVARTKQADAAAIEDLIKRMRNVIPIK